MSYGKVLAKIKEAGETITLQENGQYYEMNSTVTGRHRLWKPATSPLRLQAHWEGIWGALVTRTTGGLR